MKRYFQWLLCLMAGVTFAAPLGVDVSGTKVVPNGKDGLTMTGVKVDTVPGQTFSVQLKWDGDRLVFYPASATVEVQQPVSRVCVLDAADYSGDQLRLTLTVGSASIALQVLAVAGSPFFFNSQLYVIQNGTQYNFDTYLSSVDANTGLLSPDGGWSGYGQMFAGIKQTGTLSKLTNFNYAAPFTIVYSMTSPAVTVTC
jgi:hypothetical protein